MTDKLAREDFTDFVHVAVPQRDHSFWRWMRGLSLFTARSPANYFPPENGWQGISVGLGWFVAAHCMLLLVDIVPGAKHAGMVKPALSKGDFAWVKEEKRRYTQIDTNCVITNKNQGGATCSMLFMSLSHNTCLLQHQCTNDFDIFWTIIYIYILFIYVVYLLYHNITLNRCSCSPATMLFLASSSWQETPASPRLAPRGQAWELDATDKQITCHKGHSFTHR